MDNQSDNTLIIVKVGTSLLVETKNQHGRLNDRAFQNIGHEIRSLANDHAIILVSSGAVAAGQLHCQNQSGVTLGWNIILKKWQTIIGKDQVTSALLTKQDAYGSTINRQLAKNTVHIVNENDDLTDTRIKFGNNDYLAAALAAICAGSSLFKTVRLVLLTDKHGLNREAANDSSLIRTVNDIRAVEQYASGTTNYHTRGGMITKIQAAKVAKQAGVATYIANGLTSRAISKALARQIGTYFEVSNH